MAFRSIDNKSRGSPNDVTNSTDATWEVNDAVTCRRSKDVPTPRTTHDVVGQQRPSSRKRDDSAPSPSTPLRQRRLPASFWQEPNVPRRSSSRRSDAVGSTSPLSSPFHHHHQPSFDCCRPAALLHRRQYHCGPSAPCPAWTRTDRRDFLPDWNDVSAFNFDVPAKPQPASAAAAVDFVRHFAHLSPWSVVGAGLPGGYPLLMGAPDYAGHGGSLTVPSPSDELAASAAVVAAYLRWRAAEEGCKPVAETTPTSPSVADWSSLMWRPCSTGATTASFSVQRLHRYHPY